jgi:hypothetical protein
MSAFNQAGMSLSTTWIWVRMRMPGAAWDSLRQSHQTLGRPVDVQGVL